MNSKAKGNNAELKLAKLLTEKFKKPFSRTLGSGSRPSQVELPDHARRSLTGDLCTPDGFNWLIECKSGYAIDLNNLCKSVQIDRFLTQVRRDANQAGLRPMLLWKRSRKPWVAIIERKWAPAQLHYCMFYAEWLVIPLDDLLDIPEGFWFAEPDPVTASHWSRED